MLTAAEKREFDKLNRSFEEVRDRLDLLPLLVEMNANLKAIKESLSVKEEATKLAAELKEGIDSIQSDVDAHQNT